VFSTRIVFSLAHCVQSLMRGAEEKEREREHHCSKCAGASAVSPTFFFSNFDFFFVIAEERNGHTTAPRASAVSRTLIIIAGIHEFT
jgi:hypothetical protein